MKFDKHLFLAFIALSLIITSTVIIPIKLNLKLPILLAEYHHPLMDKWNLEIVKSDSIEITHLNSFEQIKKELGPTKIKKRKTGRWPRPEIWYFHRGYDLILHSLKLQKTLKQLKCKLIKSNESKEFKQIDSEFHCPNDNESQSVRFQLSNKWSDDIAKISILFEVEKEISIQNLAILDSLNFIFGLIVNPYYLDSNLTHDIRKLKSPDILIKTPLEAKGRFPDRLTLAISHTSWEIHQKISTLSQISPNALGLMPVLGSLALHHSGFLDNFMKTLNERKLILAIPHKNNNSLIEDRCTHFQVNCQYLSRGKFSAKSPSQFIKSQIKESRKRGTSILTLPLRKDYLYAADSIFSDFEGTGISVVELNQISKYE
jgi:polysaccharide deacetylase 2 family uncharacterized protein YibQ